MWGLALKSLMALGFASHLLQEIVLPTVSWTRTRLRHLSRPAASEARPR
jgi:hypothetical protein